MQFVKNFMQTFFEGGTLMLHFVLMNSVITFSLVEIIAQLLPSCSNAMATGRKVDSAPLIRLVISHTPQPLAP